MSDSRFPNFPGINAPSTDFAAVRDGRRARVFHFDVDLSTARSIAANTCLILPIAGNSFFSDQSALQGNATVYFQDFTLNPTDAPPMFVGPGFVAQIPFTTMLIENVAQAGRRLRFFYGVDIDFKPSLSGSIALTGTINAAPYGATYGASYKSLTSLAANTPDTVFAPGANINGALIHGAEFFSANAAGAGYPAVGFLAKASAPVSAIDGDVILSTSAYSGGSCGQLQQPVFITAGRGLYFISTMAETANAAMRNCRYTLL